MGIYRIELNDSENTARISSLQFDKIRLTHYFPTDTYSCIHIRCECRIPLVSLKNYQNHRYKKKKFFSNRFPRRGPSSGSVLPSAFVACASENTNKKKKKNGFCAPLQLTRNSCT